MSLLNKLKNYQKLNPKKLFETFMTVTVISLVTMGAVYDSDIKEITVMRTDAFASTLEISKTKTRQSNVQDFLKEREITIADDEILNADISGELHDGEILHIKQGRYIKVIYDGNTRTILTSKANVADALLENGIQIGENDWVEPSFESAVTEGMKVTLRRITVQEETVAEEVLSPIETRTDDNMFEDERIVLEQGRNGKKDVTYRVMYEDGKEVCRDVISEKSIVEPTVTVEVVGTKPARTVTKQGKTFKYARKLTVKATAYDTSLEENGGYTKTAMGLTPGYGIVAVDPRVIPLGTKLYIESTDDGASWTYGYCIAGDTGGAIKGNRVDLCYYTQAECIRFGRRNATVYVIE